MLLNLIVHFCPNKKLPFDCKLQTILQNFQKFCSMVCNFAVPVRPSSQVFCSDDVRYIVAYGAVLCTVLHCAGYSGACHTVPFLSLPMSVCMPVYCVVHPFLY